MPSDVLAALLAGRRTEAETLARGRQLSLHEAAALGHTSRLRVLLEGGAAVDARTEDGLTALHLAALFGHEPAARLLVERGADPLTADHTGAIAADLAERGGQVQLAALLRAASSPTP